MLKGAVKAAQLPAGKMKVSACVISGVSLLSTAKVSMNTEDNHQHHLTRS